MSRDRLKAAIDRELDSYAIKEHPGCYSYPSSEDILQAIEREQLLIGLDDLLLLITSETTEG